MTLPSARIDELLAAAEKAVQCQRESMVALKRSLFGALNATQTVAFGKVWGHTGDVQRAVAALAAELKEVATDEGKAFDLDRFLQDDSNLPPFHSPPVKEPAEREGEDEEPVARETFIQDEEGGIAVGILIDMPDGTQIWSGAASNALFEAQDEGVRDELAPAGQFVVKAPRGGSPTILCQVADTDTGIEIARAVAAYCASPLPVEAVTVDEMVMMPREPTKAIVDFLWQVVGGDGWEPEVIYDRLIEEAAALSTTTVRRERLLTDDDVATVVARARAAISLGEATGSRGMHASNIYNVASDLLATVERLEASNAALMAERTNLETKRQQIARLEADVASLADANEEERLSSAELFSRAFEAEAQRDQLAEALRDIIAADDAFRASMSPTVVKDPLTIACDRAREALASIEQEKPDV